MKPRQALLTLLLSSALWVPAALAQAGNDAASPSPSNTSATRSTTPPSDNATSAPTPLPNGSAPAQTGNTAQPDTGASNATASADTSGWMGKTIIGSNGKTLGKVTETSGDKITLDTKYGSVQLATFLIAANESGNLEASTTSTQDVQAMVKTQQGDSQGAAAASKRHHEAKPKPKTGEVMSNNEQYGPSTEQAPADEAPAQLPAEQTPPH